MINNLKSLYVEFHILQSFPVSCLNRDDVGSPKTAIVGGVERARVSSQAWKRVIRLKLQEDSVKIATRTKKVDDLIVAKILENNEATEEVARECATQICSYIGKDSLILITDKEVDALVDIIRSKGFKIEAEKKKTKAEKDKDKAEGIKTISDEKLVANALKGIVDKGLDSIDVALFGRMVAKINELGVNGACSVAHAISTHKVENEVDFFTALDDLAGDEGGSSHLGETEFNSATYYRYVTLNLGQLAETLFGNSPIDVEQLNEVIGAFVKALYLAIPNARQNTQAAFNSWDYAKILVRKGQPVQASFDKPVQATRTSGYSEPSIEALNSNLARHKRVAGDFYGLQSEIEVGLEDSLSITDAIKAIQQKVSELNG